MSTESRKPATTETRIILIHAQIHAQRQFAEIHSYNRPTTKLVMMVTLLIMTVALLHVKMKSVATESRSQTRLVTMETMRQETVAVQFASSKSAKMVISIPTNNVTTGMQMPEM